MSKIHRECNPGGHREQTYRRKMGLLPLPQVCADQTLGVNTTLLPLPLVCAGRTLGVNTTLVPLTLVYADWSLGVNPLLQHFILRRLFTWRKKFLCQPVIRRNFLRQVMSRRKVFTGRKTLFYASFLLGAKLTPCSRSA